MSEMIPPETIRAAMKHYSITQLPGFLNHFEPRKGEALRLVKNLRVPLTKLTDTVFTASRQSTFLEFLFAVHAKIVLSRAVHEIEKAPLIKFATDAELLNMKFDGGDHFDWFNQEADLVAIWLEPGRTRNEGCTGALIDIINACDGARRIPLWIGLSPKWPYGKGHAHHCDRVTDWWNEAEAFTLDLEPVKQVKLPTKG